MYAGNLLIIFAYNKTKLKNIIENEAKNQKVYTNIENFKILQITNKTKISQMQI